MSSEKPALKTTQGYFDALDPPTRATALAIRKLVNKTFPELDEVLCMGVPTWKGNAWVCYIADYTHHVNLGFYKGAKIKDPTGLLEGTGKLLRHVKVPKGERLPEKGLAILLRKAVQADRK